ncbi:MAG: hypothetical protein AAF511_01530 [Pseudomonadota bacterium]
MRLMMALVASLSLVGGCTTADKQSQSSAYEACKGRQDPQSRDRCIAAETDRLRTERADSDQTCLAMVEEQRFRAAMIDGRAAPTNRTGPAQRC